MSAPLRGRAAPRTSKNACPTPGASCSADKQECLPHSGASCSADKQECLPHSGGEPLRGQARMSAPLRGRAAPRTSKNVCPTPGASRSADKQECLPHSGGEPLAALDYSPRPRRPWGRHSCLPSPRPDRLRRAANGVVRGTADAIATRKKDRAGSLPPGHRAHNGWSSLRPPASGAARARGFRPAARGGAARGRRRHARAADRPARRRCLPRRPPAAAGPASRAVP
jgi:hypothetical protein